MSWKKLIKKLFEIHPNILNGMNLIGLSLTSYGVWIATGKSNLYLVIGMYGFIILAFMQIILANLKYNE